MTLHKIRQCRPATESEDEKVSIYEVSLTIGSDSVDLILVSRQHCNLGTCFGDVDVDLDFAGQKT